MATENSPKRESKCEQVLSPPARSVSPVISRTLEVRGADPIEQKIEPSTPTLKSGTYSSFQSQPDKEMIPIQVLAESKPRAAAADSPSRKVRARKIKIYQKEPIKEVDILVIGAGPAALGLLINAWKSNRHQQLLQNDSICIIDTGTSFGGGHLCEYGIRSNTSAKGFLKCTYRKPKPEKKPEEDEEPVRAFGAGPGREKDKKAKSNKKERPVAVQKAPKESIPPTIDDVLTPLRELY